jgi:hypothetical protein
VLLGHLGHKHQTICRSVDEGASRARCVIEPLDASLKELAPPLAHRLFGEPHQWCDLRARNSVGRQQQDHFCSLSIPMRVVCARTRRSSWSRSWTLTTKGSTIHILTTRADDMDQLTMFIELLRGGTRAESPDSEAPLSRNSARGASFLPRFLS